MDRVFRCRRRDVKCKTCSEVVTFVESVKTHAQKQLSGRYRLWTYSVRPACGGVRYRPIPVIALVHDERQSRAVGNSAAKLTATANWQARWKTDACYQEHWSGVDESVLPKIVPMKARP